jgi:transcriptional regulator with XRE-family HTH domain
MATFGQRFKMLRNEKGLKQSEVLDKFNKKYNYAFTKSAVSQYENDKRIPEIDALKNFADFFNVSVDFLLGETDTRNPESEEAKAAENLIKVDPDLFITMCRAKDMPEEERRRIKEYAAFEIEKWLKNKK